VEKAPAGPLPVVDEPEWVTGRGVAVRMRFEGRKEVPELRPGPRTPGVYNYFLGKDPARWRTGVPAYASLRYVGMYRGVDVQLRERGGSLEYDLLLEPEADLSQVRVRVDGADLSLDAEGSLVMHTALGPVRQPPPLTWEVTPAGEKRRLACSYVMHGPDCFGFAVPRWSGELALVVDPTLLYSTFLGGGSADEGVTVMQEPLTGLIAVTGATASTNFPTTTGVYSTTYNGGASDAFVTTMTSSKTLVYTTYIGGTGDDYGRGLFVRIGGTIWVAGTTYSTDFPTSSGAYDTTHNGSADWWVAQLPSNGASLVYSTYVGGPGSDGPRTIKVESNGNATVMGVAGASGFPTTAGAYDTTYNGSVQDAAVVRLNAAGTALVFATYVGGSGVDYALASDLGPNGEVIMTGYASAGDFPATTGSYDNSWNGAFDAFVTSLHQSGTKLNYSTFLGATGNDIGYALAVDANGVVTVAGETDGRGGFPTTPGAFQTVFKALSGQRDVFVTRLDATGSKLIYSTFLGGTAFDGANGLAIASDGSTVVTGDTQSADFPVTPDAHDTTHNGQRDVFVSHLDATGKVLQYSTFLGDTGQDQGNKITFGMPVDIATVTGKTNSANFPTTSGAYDTTHNSADDAFIAQLQLHPSGVKRFGASTPSCNGDVALYGLADVTSPSPGFGLACLKSPPSTIGFLAVTAKRLPTPVPLVGVNIWVNPDKAQLILVPVSTSANGTFNLPIPIPSGLKKGLMAHVQVIWANTAACGGVNTNSASDALELTIQ